MIAIGKRGRTAVGDGDEMAQFEWKWGPRSYSEVGEKAIAEFMAQFLLDRKMLTTDVDSDEEEEEAQTSRRRNGASSQTQPRQAQDKTKMFEDMIKGIARAAGGTLHDIRR